MIVEWEGDTSRTGQGGRGGRAGRNVIYQIVVGDGGCGPSATLCGHNAQAEEKGEEQREKVGEVRGGSGSGSSWGDGNRTAAFSSGLVSGAKAREGEGLRVKGYTPDSSDAAIGACQGQREGEIEGVWPWIDEAGRDWGYHGANGSTEEWNTLKVGLVSATRMRLLRLLLWLLLLLLLLSSFDSRCGAGVEVGVAGRRAEVVWVVVVARRFRMEGHEGYFSLHRQSRLETGTLEVPGITSSFYRTYIQ